MRKAAILVGGRGERLGALTDAIPKPMADIKKRPFLEYQLALLKKYQISEIVLCVGYLKDAILGYFGDGSRFGLRIEYSIENDFLGTGGALKQAAGLLSDEFLMLYGDSFLPIDYTALCAEWEKSSTEAMVVCYDNHECIAENNIYLDPQGLVQSYNKRTPDKRANSVEAGVSVLKKEVLDLIPPQRAVSLEEEIFPKLIQRQQLKGYLTAQRYYDIGTPQRLREIEGVL